MSVNINQYFPVNSTVVSVLGNTKVYAGIGLSGNTLIPTSNPVLQFFSADEVKNYFGNSSDEYAASVKYFKSYDGALAKPRYIYFGKFVLAAIAPYLRGGKVTNPVTKLTALQAITTGNITVNVNGVAYATTGIDLSSATSLSNAATLLTTAITTANAALATAVFTIVYDATFQHFIAAITGTGSTKTMGYASSTGGEPTLATLLLFTQAEGAILSQGADVADAATNLDNLLPYFTDQYSIGFVNTIGGLVTDTVLLDTSAWVDGENTPAERFAFFLWTNETAIQIEPDTTSIWYQITQAGYAGTAIFDEVLLDNASRVFAAMGAFASLDLTLASSAITLAFKTQDGLAASVTDSDIAQILNGPPQNPNGKSINYYADVGINGSNTQVKWFYGGYLTGKWKFIDNQVAQIWIAFQFQVALASLFNQLGQVPNDPDGDGQVRAVLSDRAEQSITNGIIAKGVVFDASTVQEIRTTYGVSAQELTNNGYVLVKSASSQAQRQIRESSPWFFLYVKASAIQYLPVNTVTYF